uniref:CenH3 n=1 Tax=Lathyrus clymenum TaxID=3855 RepID=A0A0D3QM12_LATCY|nr:CenH3 [Lathyrus clymenum]AJO61194.1 CenH3 [Lathyrus clymenum]AJO61195.1 CenH3 [Lathyrus clymenum]AJO61196.1 CenH3 [Lathyrus clymenum]AKA94126.1 centromere-specific variant of histone H3 [Lathyrus clymenum]
MARVKQKPRHARENQERKKRRNKPGTVALREIRKLQKTCQLLIPYAPFVRCVREITNQVSSTVTRWTPQALLSLQEAAEDTLIRMFEVGWLCTLHAKRVTLMKKDIELTRRVTGIGRPW